MPTIKAEQCEGCHEWIEPDEDFLTNWRGKLLCSVCLDKAVQQQRAGVNHE